MIRRTLGLACALAVLTIGPTAGADEDLTLDGDVPSGEPEHVFVPFDVPAGIVEIEIVHDDLEPDNILDWGLYDPRGTFRGWGGGNLEPAIVGVDRASRSYLTGPIDAGTWNVHVGKAKIKVDPAKYHLEIHMRNVATLPPQPERAPFRASAALVQGVRWYAGDFHVHSRESGDAKPTFEEIADYAIAHGLDFVEITDHNTVSQLDWLVSAQAKYPTFLFLAGLEFTTYNGHANVIGARAFVDHKIGLPGVTIEGAVKAIADQGALLSINHPSFDVGDACIGCVWGYDVDPAAVRGVEVFNGAGLIFNKNSIAFWDALCDKGAHAAALGGSDDHSAGVGETGLNHAIGTPTTMVLATQLSEAAIMGAVRNGRTVVRWDGDAPMVELSSSVPPIGDTINADVATLTARVTSGQGKTMRFVKNGGRLDPVDITGDPFETSVEATAPATGEDRWRVEVLEGTAPHVLTSHLWIKVAGGAASGPGSVASSGSAPMAVEGGGCGCATQGAAGRSPLLLLLALITLAWRRTSRGLPRTGEPRGRRTAGAARAWPW